MFITLMEKSVSVFNFYINNLRKKGAGRRMVDVYEIKRGNKAKKLVNDFISF
jgi:hypothetical protein